MIRNKIIIYILIGFIFFSFKLIPIPYPFPRLNLFAEMPQNSTNPVTIEGALLGKFLFYDTILSGNKNIACANCHKQEYAFSDAPNQYSVGGNGQMMKRNTQPLFNLAWKPAFFWDGRVKTIEEQIAHPLTDKEEMNINFDVSIKALNKEKYYKKLFLNAFGDKKIDSTRIVNAIAQFLRTLISYNSKYDMVLNKKSTFTSVEKKGFELMNDQTKGDCLHCHNTDANVLGSTFKYSNNGLDEVKNYDRFKDLGRGKISGNKNDNGKFMIPSLRNIALTAPYMHDGRFKTLEEVLDFYSEGVKKSITIDSKMEFVHKGGNHLSDSEKYQIIAFLHTFTDSVFILNPMFSNPLKN